MTTSTVHKDTTALTMTITTDFDSPIDRVWQMWENPRLLERWWGPPTFPATMTEHDLSPGGRVAYYMTGPEGEKYHGWWRITSVEAPARLEFDDGFSDDSGKPSEDMPTISVKVTLAETAAGTRMAIESVFRSTEDMQQLLTMGMEEGMVGAIGQIEGLLAEIA